MPEKRFGDRRGEKVPGDRRMSGSQNHNGLAGHTKSGESLGGFPNAGPRLIPPVMKAPRLDPEPGGPRWRYSIPRTSRQRPSKRPQGGTTTY